MKVRGRQLALFGGVPLFDSPRPTGQLYSPVRSVFLERLDRILEGRRFSNGGPFQEELESRLADWHAVDHVVAFGNASFALIVLMRHLALEEKPNILLPSFSYRGLPHFIQWAGKMPQFADVDSDTHTLDVREVARHVSSGDIAMILAVNNVTGPAELDEIDRLSDEMGVPVVYDSVYAIAAEYRGKPFGGYGKAEVFSLHATKLVNGFEGGYVTTNDAALAEALRQIRNFGYDSTTPNILHLGLNGKLNEIHAAMALSSLDQIDVALDHNKAILESYATGLNGNPWLQIKPSQAGMVSNNEMVLMEIAPEHPLDRDELLRLLQAEGILARPYFSPPLHRSKNCPASARGARLPIADELSERFVQLPTGAFLSETDASVIASFLCDLTESACDVRSALDREGAVS